MGGSAVNITNWGGIESPVQNSLLGYYGAIQANADQYAAVAQSSDTAWKMEHAEDRAEAKRQYDEWVANQEKWQTVETALGVIQQGIGLYFADKQYDAAREALDHQISVWETEKLWADRYQNLWYDKYRPVEENLLDEISTRPLYDADYQTVQDRILPTIRSEFSRAREDARRCFDPTCVGEICEFNKTMAIAEANAVVSSIDRAYRTEEAREDMKNDQRREEIYKIIGLGRNYITDSLNSLNSARAAATTAASINPYAPLAAAVGNAFGEFRQMAANRRELASANIRSSAAGSYYNSGYDGLTNRAREYKASTLSQVTPSSNIVGVK